MTQPIAPLSPSLCSHCQDASPCTHLSADCMLAPGQVLTAFGSRYHAEIAREPGFKSTNAAEEHLRALARKGVIALVPAPPVAFS